MVVTSFIGVAVVILIIGGATDRHTTEADTRRLFAAAREPKELWLVPDAAHVDYLAAAGDAYRTRVLAFFAGALQNRSWIPEQEKE